MAARRGRWRMVGVLLLVLLIPAAAEAGPFLGEWGYFWNPAPDCPRGEYSPLHYWAPELYVVRSCVHPVNLDQYPPGPCPPVPVAFMFEKYCCRTTPPAPSAPYANPSAYYGIDLVPSQKGSEAPTTGDRGPLPQKLRE